MNIKYAKLYFLNDIRQSYQIQAEIVKELKQLREKLNEEKSLAKNEERIRAHELEMISILSSASGYITEFDVDVDEAYKFILN